jgi:hypothetical protein
MQTAAAEQGRISCSRLRSQMPACCHQVSLLQVPSDALHKYQLFALFMPAHLFVCVFSARQMTQCLLPQLLVLLLLLLLLLLLPPVLVLLYHWVLLLPPLPPLLLLLPLLHWGQVLVCGAASIHSTYTGDYQSTNQSAGCVHSLTH